MKLQIDTPATYTVSQQVTELFTVVGIKTELITGWRLMRYQLVIAGLGKILIGVEQKLIVRVYKIIFLQIIRVDGSLNSSKYY